MADISQQQALEELKKRGITVSSESVLEDKGTTFEEFKKGAESLFKGSAKGIVDILGGWGNLYDYLKKNPDPSAFSSAGIMKGIRDLGGPDLQQISGYRGAYDVGQAGAPAALMTAAGLPGLFSRTPLGIAGEFGVAGGTNVAAQQVAPDSPLAQFALQSLPYGAKAGFTAARGAITRPVGTVEPSVDELLRIGRMTPGEATGSRRQLATEARVEASPAIEARGEEFRRGQALDTESFLSNVFNRASSQAVDPTQAAQSAFTAFSNYGKVLSNKLRSDANKDFKAAKASGGRVDTTPVLSAVDSWLSRIPPETPGFESLKSAISKIKDEYEIPATPAKVTPSTILGPTGQPAAVSITPAVPAGVRDIDIDRLQKNLSAWSEAVYSGKADFGKGNIFEGVAPGQAKGVAISVLNGFRQALDDAISQGVPGAEKLKAARDNFKNNLAQIEEYSNRPLTKYFDVETASALTPENVVAKLSAAKPSERLFLAQVLQNSPDGAAIFDTVRRDQFNKILQKASEKAAGAAEGAPEFTIQTALTELSKKKGDFDFLFTNAQDKADALAALAYMRKVVKSESAKTGGGITGSDVYAGTRGIGAQSQLANLLKEVFTLSRDIIATPNAFADVIFNKDTVKAMAEAQKTPTVKKLTNVVTRLGDSAAKFAPRVGPMVDTTQPTDTTQQDMQAPQITPEEALQQLKMMGVEIQ